MEYEKSDSTSVVGLPGLSCKYLNKWNEGMKMARLFVMENRNTKREGSGVSCLGKWVYDEK